MSAEVIKAFIVIVLLTVTLSFSSNVRGETVEEFCEGYYQDIIYFKVNTQELSDVEKALARAKVNQLVRKATEGKDTYFCEINRAYISTHF